MALVRDPDQERIYRAEFARGRNAIRQVFDECRDVHDRWAAENQVSEELRRSTKPTATPLVTEEFRP